MKWLVGICFFIVIAGCYANLEVHVDGVVTDSRDFCSNQMLVFVCTLPTSAFEWRAGALIPDGQGQVTIGNTETIGNITLTARGISENRTSTLEVAASTDLNGVMVACFDPGNPGQQLVATVRVYGMSCPVSNFAVENDNCTSVYVYLSDISRCTREYSAVISGETTEVISSVLNESDRNAAMFIIGSFNLNHSSLELYSTYYVSINVTFFDGSSITCPSVTVQPLSNCNLLVPVVSIAQNYISSLRLTITQPGVSAVNLRSYNVTVISIGSESRQSIIVTAMRSSSTNVMINNLQLCRYNYSVSVVAISSRGFSSEPFLDTTNSANIGNFDLSDFAYEMGVVSWSVPTDLMDCIAGYEYSFQYSGVSGVLPANVNMLSIDILNISTPCDVDVLTVNPIYHNVKPQEKTSSRNIMECVSTGKGFVKVTTDKHVTTECNLARVLMAVIIPGILIIILLMIVIVLMAVKIKILQTKVNMPNSTNEDVKYDEIAMHSKSRKKKADINLSKQETDIAMVGCEAYGKISVSHSVQDERQHGEGAVVYEAL